MLPSAPARTSAPHMSAAPPTGTGHARLHHLFRASLREGKVHPLMRLMLRRAAGGDAAARPSPTRRPLAAALPLLPLAQEQVRRRVAGLPHLPQAALRALRTLRRDDASLDEVAADLGCDASLTARVLRLANSPFYGVAGRVSSARDAAQMLGRRTLESLLTVSAVTAQLGGARSQVFDAAAFWRHSLAAAMAARALARANGSDEECAFVAALLHDIGLLAMSVYFPAELDALLLRALADDRAVGEIEDAHALTPHTVVGSWIAAHWHFPPAVVQAIAAHHTPGTAANARDTLVDTVHVADAIAHALDLAQLDHERVPEVDPEAWRRCALADDDFMRLLDEIETGVRELCAALAL